MTARTRPAKKMNPLPDPKQGAWSTGHVATVLTFRVGTTINCDCGSPFHGSSREAAEAKWERHVKMARAREEARAALVRSAVSS